MPGAFVGSALDLVGAVIWLLAVLNTLGLAKVATGLAADR